MMSNSWSITWPSGGTSTGTVPFGEAEGNSGRLVAQHHLPAQFAALPAHAQRQPRADGVGTAPEGMARRSWSSDRLLAPHEAVGTPCSSSMLPKEAG